MNTEKILETFKAKAIAQFTEQLDKLVLRLADEMKAEIEGQHTQVLTDTLLGKRKRLAETEEVQADLGMTLDEIKMHNAEVDGWNSSRRQLRKRLLGTDDEVVTDLEQPAPAAPEPAPTPVEPVPEEPVPTPEPEVVVTP